MIKLFRKIREKLLTENKTSKYFLYAFGEIILVVIGILIALQINHWNDERKLDAVEIQFLKDFERVLKGDRRRLTQNSLQNIRIKKSANILLDVLKTDRPFNDSLKYHFGNTTTIWSFDLNSSVFESLKSNDLNIISNKELRIKILNIYDSEDRISGYSEYRDFIKFSGVNILNTRFESFWASNYEEWKSENNYFTGYDPSKLSIEALPVDYNKLKNDHEYFYFLRGLINRYNWLIELPSYSLELGLNDILQIIEEELNALENK